MSEQHLAKMGFLRDDYLLFIRQATSRNVQKNVNRNMPVPTTMQTILQPVYAKHAYS